MPGSKRETTLKIAVGVVVGLFLLDRLILTPAAAGWKAQGERIATLREQVTRGRQLLEREKSVRAKWDEMQRTDLPAENSEAEKNALLGWAKWATESRVAATSIKPTWRSSDEGYSLMEVRASTTNTQAALGQLMYLMESDPLPVRLEECELTARDPKGQQVTGELRFSFIRLKDGPQK